MKQLKLLDAEIFSWKWIVLILIMFPYFARLRGKLFDIAIAQQETINQWDVIFRILCDYFFIYYFIVPVCLISFIFYLFSNWSYSILIRTKNFTHWLSHVCNVIAIKVFIMLSIWVLIAGLLTIGVPFEWEWSSYATQGDIAGNYSYYFAESGILPILMVILQLLLIFIFIVMLFISMATFYVVIQKRFLPFILAVIYYFGMLISFKMVPYWYGWLKVENIMFLSSAYFTWSTILPPFIALSITILACYSIIHFYEKMFTSHMVTWIKENGSVFLFACLCVIGSLVPVMGLMPEDSTIWDFLYIKLYGVSDTGFQMLTYLNYSIVYIGLMYLFQLNLLKRTSGLLYYEVIRYRSYHVWFSKLMIKSVVGGMAVLIVLALFTLGVGYVHGYEMESSLKINPSIPITVVIYHYIINGCLQMLSYFLIVFIVYWMWNKQFTNLLALGLTIILGMPQLNINKMLPLSLNSFGYLNSAQSAWRISITLMAWITLMLVIVYVLFKLRKGER